MTTLGFYPLALVRMPLGPRPVGPDMARLTRGKAGRIVMGRNESRPFMGRNGSSPFPLIRTRVRVRDVGIRTTQGGLCEVYVRFM